MESSADGAKYGGRATRRREQRGVSVDVVMMVVVLTVMDAFSFAHPSHSLAVEVIRGLVGLAVSLVAPGFVTIGSIFAKEGDISLLLRWVLIIAISCFYDVVLAFVMSGVGIRLDQHNVALFDTALLVLGCFWLVWARRRARSNGHRVHSWKDETGLLPYVVSGALIFAVVLWMLIPNFQSAKPVLYLTSSSGQMAIPYSASVRTLRLQVHVTNPRPQSMVVELREYLNGRQQGPPVHHKVSAYGTWTRKISFTIPDNGRGRATFVLSDPNAPSLHRKVWFDYGT